MMGRASANFSGSIHEGLRAGPLSLAKEQNPQAALQTFVTDTSHTAGMRKRREVGCAAGVIVRSGGTTSYPVWRTGCTFVGWGLPFPALI